MKSQNPSGPRRGLGILSFLKKPRGSGDPQRTDDPGPAKKVLRRLDRAQGDAELLEIGKSDPQEEVARAAYRRVGSQKELAAHIRALTDRSRRLLALECLTDQGELMGLARSLDEPLCAEAAKRIGDAGLLATLAEDENAPDAARCAAYEKLNQPRMVDALRLASTKALPPQREKAAERILQTGDAALIARAAGLALASQETPQARLFVTRAAKAFPEELLKLADGTWGCNRIRATAFDALGCTDEAQLVRLTSEKIPEGERREAAAYILASGDEGQLGKAMDMLLSGRRNPVARQFIQDALDARPGLVETFGARILVSESCPDRKAVADAILGTGDEALAREAAEKLLLRPQDYVSVQFIRRALRAHPGLVKAIGARLLADKSCPDRKAVADAILATGDEALVRQAVQALLAGPQDPVNKQFVLDAAAAYPGIVKELWPRVRKWGRVNRSEHTDYTRKAPHVDSTRYYDFYRYPDGRVVPNRGGRKTHTDGPMPSSDCANYGHTDTNSHTDNAELLEKGYHALFPKAVKGGE